MSGQYGRRPVNHRPSPLSSDKGSDKISDDANSQQEFDRSQPNESKNGSKEYSLPQSSSASNLWSKMRRSHSRMASSSHANSSGNESQRFLRTRHSHDSLTKQTEREYRNGFRSGGTTFGDNRSMLSSDKSKASLTTFVEDSQQIDQQQTDPTRDQVLCSFRRLHVIVDSDREIEDISLYFEKDRGRISEKAEWYSNGSWHGSILAFNANASLIDTESKDNNIIIPDVRTMDFVIGNFHGERVIELFPKDEAIKSKGEYPQRTTMLVKAKTPLLFMRWVAAFLLWTGTRPCGVHNRILPQLTPYLSPASSGGDGEGGKSSAAASRSNASTIKVGRLDILCHSTAEGDIVYSPRDFVFKNYNYVYTGEVSRTFFTPEASKLNGSWIRANASLKGNGILDLRPESGKGLIGSVNLTNVTRQHIRQIDPSIFGVGDCLVIENRTRETDNNNNNDTRTYLGSGNIVLSFGDNLAYDVWYFLFKCFSRPILYGPLGGDKTGNYFRVEYRATVQIVDAKISELGLINNNSSSNNNANKNQGPYTFVELDSHGKIIGRTTLRGLTYEPFWREDFVLEDISADSDKVKLTLCQKVEGSGKHNGSKVNISGGFEGGANDTPWAHIVGQTIVPLEFKSEVGTSSGCSEKTVTAVGVNSRDRNTQITGGEVHVKMDVNEWVILPGVQYSRIRELLLDLDNDITVKIADQVRDLGSVSQLFLDIFQFEEQTVKWIKYLTAYELRESEAIKQQGEAEKHDIDFNVLFRGNTILTKALDAHMRRVGSRYLEKTLGRIVRVISEEDIDCEIDPSKTAKKKDEVVQQNWSQLIRYMSNVWLCIYRSTDEFPAALKEIFVAQQEMVERRFGELMDGSVIQYNIAVPFVFLRFICPAFLNPQLFGLLVQVPSARARRTLTLIAKTLQTLANRTQFGLKEPWMSPMNTFLQSHSHELNEFLANVTTTTATPTSENRQGGGGDGLFNMRERAYRVSKNIVPRLEPPTYREGLPSLPHLIDKDRSYAELVHVYLQARARVSRVVVGGQDEKEGGGGGAQEDFNKECLRISDLTKELVEGASKDQETPFELSGSEWDGLVGIAKSRLQTIDDASKEAKGERENVMGRVGEEEEKEGVKNYNNNNSEKITSSPVVINTPVPTSSSSFEAEVMAELSSSTTTTTDDDSVSTGASSFKSTKDARRATAMPHSASSSGKFRLRFKSSG